MNNDTLIDQARRLYAALSVAQYIGARRNRKKFNRLERLVIWAYCRYQRRLNRCVLCYQHRLDDCPRDPQEHTRRLCPALIKRRRDCEPNVSVEFGEREQ